MKSIVLALVAVAAFSISASSAQAHGGGHHGHNHRHSFGIGHFHAPSLHYHRVYHPTHLHWTPNRGWHTHGHIDIVPHYTPGHFHW